MSYVTCSTPSSKYVHSYNRWVHDESASVQCTHQIMRVCTVDTVYMWWQRQHRMKCGSNGLFSTFFSSPPADIQVNSRENVEEKKWKFRHMIPTQNGESEIIFHFARVCVCDTYVPTKSNYRLYVYPINYRSIYDIHISLRSTKISRSALAFSLHFIAIRCSSIFFLSPSVLLLYYFRMPSSLTL